MNIARLIFGAFIRPEIKLDFSKPTGRLRKLPSLSERQPGAAKSRRYDQIQRSQKLARRAGRKSRIRYDKQRKVAS